MANEVSVEITVEEKQALQALTALTKRFNTLGDTAEATGKDVDKAGKQIGDGVEKGSKRASRAFDTFKGVLSAQVVVGAFNSIKNAAVGAFSTIVDATVELETIETQFRVLTGSADDARVALEEIQEFAARTPFQFPDLANAGRLLLSFGNAAEEVTPLLRTIGDVAAGSGSNIQELALIFGQVQAAGQLTGERLLQLQERAVPIGPAIAKTLGVAESSVKRLVSEGAVDVEVFTQAFQSLTQEGGLFFGATAERAETLGGLLSTLTDNFNLTAQAIGQELLPQFKEFTAITIDFLQDAKPGFTILAQAIGSFATTLVEATGGFAKFIENNFTPENARNIESLKLEVIELEQELVNLQRARTDQQGFQIFSAEDIQRAEEIKAQVATLNERIIEQRDALEFDQLERDAREQERQDAAAQKAVENEKKKFDLIAVAREEQRLKEEEIRLNEQLLNEEITQEQFDAELEANKAQQDRLAAQSENATKKQLDQKKKAIDGLNALDKKREAIEQQNASKAIGLAEATANAINAIAGDNAVAGLIISKVAAVADVFIKDAQARAAATALAASAAVVAGPGGPALFASTLAALQATITKSTALSLGIIAAQTVGDIARFQDGGIVAGTQTRGDNVLARVNSGELILNRAQQDSLAGQLVASEGILNDIRRGIDNLASQPMVIEVEGREIARTVRDEIDGGFQLAV